MAAKKSPAFGRAMKLAQSGASGFKIVGYTKKLPPADVVEIFEAFAAVKPEDAADFLATAYAGVGRFADAIRAGKKGKYPNTLHEIGELALDAGAFADAEAAFAAIGKPSAVQLVGIAVAQKAAGKSPKQTLARAAKANVAPKAIDWGSATSCYAHVTVAIVKAMILAIEGDLAGAKKLLSAERRTFAQVKQKGVRKECDDQLASPADPQWYASTIARHAGLS